MNKIAKLGLIAALIAGPAWAQTAPAAAAQSRPGQTSRPK